jgi:hypothetical protein
MRIESRRVSRAVAHFYGSTPRAIALAEVRGIVLGLNS